MIWIVPIGVAIIALILGIRGGGKEAFKIDAQKPMNHVTLWLGRAVFLLPTSLIGMVLLGDGWPPQGIDFVCLLGIAFGVIAPAHRLTLNSRREKGDFPWNYCTPTNWYDRIAIRFERRRKGWVSVSTADLIEQHHAEYWKNEPYRKLIHTAGVWLYLFEGAVLAASIIVIIQNN